VPARSGRCLQLDWRLRFDARRDRDWWGARTLAEMILEPGSADEPGADGLFRVLANEPEAAAAALGLEFADGALQFCELLGVLFGEFVQLPAEFGISNVQRNGQNGSGEQYQSIDNGRKMR